MIPTTRGGRFVALAYVVAVAALTARAFSDGHQDHWGAEIAAAVLTLPLIVPALPVIYVVGAFAWAVTDARDDGSVWPVTVTFTLMMVVVAGADVVLARTVWRSLRGSASASARTRSGA
ncbi:hypothetical protein [Nocardioides sp. URHA0020]|uniref:hypothetical protein n=1 Tax=Nocardioides sp. URHA0020 TaxID=1380392 RepID=UPI00048D9B78|nr:hypothetical protein [Nocardioides sp. URHA0020]